MPDFPPLYPAPAGFPVAAQIVAPAPDCRFLHVSAVDVAGEMTALQAWNAVMARSLPLLAQAFAIRDAISARFGVARIAGFSGAARQDVAAGDHLDFFLVEGVLPNRLLLSARDRHLDVMTCVTAESVAGGTRVAITSSVITHNWFGKIYMLPVGPAHRLIVHLMLARLRRDRSI